MIELTRLNGQRIFLNCDLLKYAEAAPDTVLTLLTGEKIVVRESCEKVVELAVDFRSRVLTATWPYGAHSLRLLLERSPATTQEKGGES